MFTVSSDVLCLQQISQKKLEFIYLWRLGICTFSGGLAPSWQYVGCWFLCYPSLAKLYYGLIDVDLNSKVKACIHYFLSKFCFSLNDSPSKTMKNVFYLI